MRNLKRWKLIPMVASAAGMLALAGCETSTSHDERSDGRVVDDKEITANVEKELKLDSTYKFQTIQTKTFGGLVQLSGFVDTDAERARAGQIAQQVKGVRQVENGIALKPEPLTPSGSTNYTHRIYSD
jgi:hyperosmotically inducible protein